jgi:Putative adhesin
LALAAAGALAITSRLAWADRMGPHTTGTRSANDTTTDFHWSGHVEQDRWVRVRNLSGWIHVERATGNDVEISGHKSWRHGDPDIVRVTMDRTGAGGGDVLVCGLWGDDSHCDEHDYESHSHERGWHHHFDGDDNDVRVDFTVLVPAGIRVLAETVNGDVEVTGATRDVDASSVNGHVDATSDGGPVDANSVNGSVEATMGRVADATRLKYSSVNGSVHVTLPADLKADVEVSTVNGSVRSDFPISVSGSLQPRSFRGTIGGGGVPLQIETVNGSIELRKGSSAD